MDSFLQDLRFAIRTLRRAPGFFAATVLTIALGIGATTAILTVVYRVVLRPLPFPESERTVVLCETSPRTADFCVASPPNVADWGRLVTALETTGVARAESASIDYGGRHFDAPGGIASPGFFKALAIRPADGRLIEDADLDPARNQVVVISDRFWRERMDGDPNAVGKSVAVNGRSCRIVGRLPASVYIPSLDFAQVWRPLTAGIDDSSQRSWRGFMAFGRLAPGASMGDLDAQLPVVRARLAAAYPATNDGWGIRTMTLREHVVGSTSATLWLFLAAVGLVLVIACANVASLLLVRASTRGPEFAVRVSLGAGRPRLVRQLLTESLVMAAAGGALGWLLAAAGTRALVTLAPSDIPRLDEVQVDARVALFAFALTALTAILFGLAPAAAAARARTTESLKSSRQTEAGPARIRSALVVAELTLSVMLLLTAGVLTRSFARLVSWSPGFDRSSVTVSWTTAPAAEGRTARSAVSLLERARDEAAAVPGITAVALASAGPLFGGTETGVVTIEGQQRAPEDQATVVNWHDIDPHYFSVLGRRIVKGRDLAATDVDGAPAVAVVNEAVAARLFPGSDPIGRRVTVQSHTADIVGVVSDVRPMRPDRAVPAEIFWPIRQYPRLGAYLVMRTAPEVGGLEHAVKARIQAIDPGMAVGSFTRLERKFEIELVSPRFNMLLIGAFALVAIILAAVGVYGVIAYSVASRTREIGVRLALGATPRGLVRDIVVRAVTLALLGMAVGVPLSFMFGRVLSGFAYGVTLTDPLVLGTTLGGFLLVTFVAGYIPASRASQVDPLLALRSE